MEGESSAKEMGFELDFRVGEIPEWFLLGSVCLGLSEIVT